MQISSGDLIFKQAVVKGFWASVVNKQLSKERKKALIVELLTLAAQKKLVLPVEGIFSFDQIKQGYALEQNTSFLKKAFGWLRNNY